MEKPAYMTQPAIVKKFFQAIQDLGRPPKVNQQYLPTIGFKNSNDRRLIQLLKFLGFTDEASIPTDIWNAYKNRDKSPQVMATRIKSAYNDLFETYPDADKRDKVSIQNYFLSKWGLGTQVAGLMEQTFRQLCGLADFGVPEMTESKEKPTLSTMGDAVATPLGTRPVTINLNIQLQLPATENEAIYDSLFSALKKHLLS